MQQGGDFQFVKIAFVHLEAGQRAFLVGIKCLGEQHGENRNTLAMAPGIGRFFVNRHVDQFDEGFEQGFKLTDQQAIVQCHGRLRSQRFGQALVGVGKHRWLTTDRVNGIEELQHADDFVFVILHRHGQEGA